ncbi:MAG: hypothetical protein KF699_07615 [Phycisphaeraceae bacterium]|nr:hypothetical protein [Phycisphaeraceae bacterium]MBX3405220.1 hypothetical protein [Phycisphaeraceae bacterium]
MSERNTGRTDGGEDVISRLESWGQHERARLVAPPDAYVRSVRAARGPRQMRRVVEGLALAAAVALVAYVAMRPSPAPPPRQEQLADRPRLPAPPDHGAVAVVSREDGPPTVAGLTRRAIESGALDWPEAARTRIAPAEPARAADAYCAGCVEELTRL